MGEPAAGSTIRTPAGLGAGGRGLWQSVVGAYELRPDELGHLEHAARLTDLADELSAAIAEHGLVVEGSKGQPRSSPLLRELRDTVELRARLLARIEVPDANDGTVWDGLSASQRARKAAHARWDRRGA